MKNRILMLVALTWQLTGIMTTGNAQSPYEFNWNKDGYIFGVGIAAGIAGLVLIENVEPLTEAEIMALDRNDVNSFDRGATYNFSETADAISDVTGVVCSVLGATLLTSAKVRSDFRTFAAMYAQMLIFAGALPTVVKGITLRTRPFAYNENAPLEKKLKKSTRLAFFSGHTTNAFAGSVFFATTFSDYFPDSKMKPYVWGGSLFLASVVAYARVEAGRHYRTDVIVGALVGSAIGHFIPKLHRKPMGGLSVYPQFHEQQMQLGVSYSFK